MAAATLSLGVAGTANATTAVDLQGTVTGVGGAPVDHAWVHVEDVATNGGNVSANTVTDGSGHYQFTTLDYPGAVRIEFGENNAFDLSTSVYYLTRWYGGSRYEAGATPVTLVPDVASTANMAMTAAGIISGSVAAQDGHALTSYWNVDLVDSDGNTHWDNVVDYTDNGTSVFRIAVEPGTYRIGGYGADSTSGDDLVYFEKWWQAGLILASATPLPVAAGQVVNGVDIRLSSALTATAAPQISGIAAVGRPLTVTPGTWNRNAGTEFSYTWMRGATIVGTGTTYTPTAADFGSRLNVIVRALNNASAGQAVSAQTDVVRWPADARGRAKALAGHKVRFAVKIVSAKQSPVRGKVVVLRGTKVVHKAVKLVKGKAVITVSGQPKGRQTYTVLYKGNKVLSKAMKNFTVRVH